MKKILLVWMFLYAHTAITAQLISISENDLFRGGNINLVKLVAENIKYKGSPYLNDSFELTSIITNSSKVFKGMMRYHMGLQIFEFKNEEGELFKILPNSDIIINHGEKQYIRANIRLQDNVQLNGVFQVLFEGKTYRLLNFLKKELVEPRKEAINAPATGASTEQLPSWVERSLYVIAKENEGISIERSHKKMLKLNFFDTNFYQEYISKTGLKLNDENSLIEFVKNMDQNIK